MKRSKPLQSCPQPLPEPPAASLCFVSAPQLRTPALGALARRFAGAIGGGGDGQCPPPKGWGGRILPVPRPLHRPGAGDPEGGQLLWLGGALPHPRPPAGGSWPAPGKAQQTGEAWSSGMMDPSEAIHRNDEDR